MHARWWRSLFLSPIQTPRFHSNSLISIWVLAHDPFWLGQDGLLECFWGRWMFEPRVKTFSSKSKKSTIATELVCFVPCMWRLCWFLLNLTVVSIYLWSRTRLRFSFFSSLLHSWFSDLITGMDVCLPFLFSSTRSNINCFGFSNRWFDLASWLMFFLFLFKSGLAVVPLCWVGYARERIKSQRERYPSMVLLLCTLHYAPLQFWR